MSKPASMSKTPGLGSRADAVHLSCGHLKMRDAHGDEPVLPSKIRLIPTRERRRRKDLDSSYLLASAVMEPSADLRLMRFRHLWPCLALLGLFDGRFDRAPRMHISVVLVGSNRWAWRLTGPLGVCYAESVKTFKDYFDAYSAGLRACIAMQGASIEDAAPTPISRLNILVGEDISSSATGDAILKSLVHALGRTGVHGALSVLNQTVPHRFTGIYLIYSNRTLKNLALFDKSGEPCPDELKSIPLGASFCQFAMSNGGFHTANSSTDVRLSGYWAKGMYNAYAGVPILDTDGTALATLCHFDYHPRHFDAVGLDRLYEAARLFTRVVRSNAKKFGRAID